MLNYKKKEGGKMSNKTKVKCQKVLNTRGGVFYKIGTSLIDMQKNTRELKNILRKNVV